jgi:CRP-like cAMP-binding protein
MPDKVWFLRRLNLFEGMSDAEVEEVSRELKMRSCAPRQSVLTQSGDRVYLLKQGRVRLYHLTADGQDVTTAVIARPTPRHSMRATSAKPGPRTSWPCSPAIRC